MTNAVKHFEWTPRGGRRVHDTPNEREVRACLPWLRAEIEVVDPSVVVCLGATAAKALLGRDFRLTRHRGELFDLLPGPPVTATMHPSAVLRGPRERREELFDGSSRTSAWPRAPPEAARRSRLRRPVRG